jgi:hypothetical protein
MNDSQRPGNKANANPITRISGGNKVLNLRSGQLGTMYYDIGAYNATTNPVVTTYNTTAGALWYTGYEKKELWNTYLTMLSEGNVDSDVTDGKNKGFAGAIDFSVTPFGTFADSEVPLTLGISGNVIAGFNYHETTQVAREKQNIGFGIKGEGGIWLMDNFVIMPVLAFDGKINIDREFLYKVGCGLKFRFSGMRWTYDEWGDLYSADVNANQFARWRYENRNVLKYAYAQIYGATVPDPLKQGNDDIHLLFRIEEPDGGAGFHDKLGFMGEFRLYNLLGKELDRGVPKELKWEAQGRVSWDLNIKHHMVTPYARGYINDDAVLKVRLGAYANFIPFTGFELAYTSANLNRGVTLPKPRYLNNSYESFFDAGRIELVVILKSDEIRPQVPKRMSDWNYPGTIQNF